MNTQIPFNNDSISKLCKDLELFDEKNCAIDAELSQSVYFFLSKLPPVLAEKFIQEAKIVVVSGQCLTSFKIDLLKKKKYLIILGNLNDLNKEAIIGLIAHLFALVDVGYLKMTKLRGVEWLKVDLHSDEVAKDWGFKTEVEELRKRRPQKMNCTPKSGHESVCFFCGQNTI